MAKSKSRAKEFQEMDEHIAKDYDPEANIEASDQGSGSEETSEDENAGTEHYVSVGKSHLRKTEGASLGAQYRGSRVSREALDQESDQDEDEDQDEEESGDDEEYADPETANLDLDTAEASDSEISSDNALGDSDEERFKDFTFRGSSKPKKPATKRATAADFMTSSDEGEEEGGADVDEDDNDMSGAELDDSDEDEEMDDGLDALVDGGDSDSDAEDDDDDDDDEEEEEDGEDDDDDEEDDEEESGSDEDEEDKKQKAQAAKPTLAALSNRADVDKGVAIRQQMKVYDGLLNLRIRLQKALVAANTFGVLEDSLEPESEPYEAAEEAAIKLLNTISSLKDNFGSSRAGDKRKRELDVSMTTEDIWSHMQEEDQRSIRFREDRLEKWSRKVQSVNVTTNEGLGSRNKTLISALQEQLNNPDNRLAKRSRVPRSCAPAQAARGVTEDEAIYDDADFYQQLLKELVDQRTVDGSSTQASAVPTVIMTVAKDTKLRKNVDRKASKGRKMRFTVHEKLQNFMAPEDRRAWEQDAIDRFFGTLFGRKMELNEDESEDDMDVDAEEAGLRLFRS
ncbi:apoptosis-antagonizing transcription factor [Thelonectria olida]|uniref:Protein BFR2 n=1 Tax=Thelonectria olida TaxID=1576542 RepID=A0A9P9ASD4_9HYPO|nr:apoptosis-antagonizing transcription factor [Thelonectria olida]